MPKNTKPPNSTLDENICSIFFSPIFTNNQKAVGANLLPPEEKRVVEEILMILKDVKINFGQELRLFLPKSHLPIIRDFKSVLKRELRRYTTKTQVYS